MLLRRLFFSIFFLIFSALSQGSVTEKNNDSSCGNITFSRLELQHREHKGMGFNQGYTTASLYLFPNKETPVIPFFNGSFHLFNSLYIASNLGAGLRFTGESESVVYGINGYYDYRNYKSLTSHQASAGIEILSKWIDFRANAYIPFSGKSTSEESLFNSFSGNTVVLQQKSRYALKQIDTELSFALPGFFRQVKMEMGLGYYYLFQRKSLVSEVGPTSGARARLNAQPLKFFSIGVEYTYDKLFHSRFNGTVSFNIPLGPSKLKGSTVKTYPYEKSSCDTYYENMTIKTQDVIRNNIIPMYSKTHKISHTDSTGLVSNIIFVNNLGEPIPIGTGITPGGSGTAEDPFTTLAQAAAVAKPNDIIYVYFGDGTTSGYDTGFILQSGQILTSSGLDLDLNSTIIPALTPGQFAKLTNSSGNVILATNNDKTSTLQGFEIEGINSGHTVNILGSAINIKNNTIKASGNNSAINIADTKGISFVGNNTVSNEGGTTGAGLIQISKAEDLSRGSLLIENNTISAAGGHDGLRLEEVSRVLAIKNNKISSSSDEGNGIYISDSSKFSKTLELSDNIISSGFENGINIDWNNVSKHDLNILRNTITSSTLTTGFVCSSQSKDGVLNLTNCIIKNIDGIGVQIISEGQKGQLTTTLSQNTISSNDNAIDIGSNSSQASTNITIVNNDTILSKSGQAINVDVGQEEGTLNLNVLNNSNVQSQLSCIGFSKGLGDFETSNYTIVSNNFVCLSDSPILSISTQGSSSLSFSDNILVYTQKALSSSSAINLSTSSNTLLTSNFVVNGNSLINKNLSTFLSATSDNNARMIVNAFNNMTTDKQGGQITITQKSNQPSCVDITENFNPLIGSVSGINFTNSGSGTLQIISSTAPTKNGIATSNSLPLSNVTLSGSNIVIAPVGTDCPPFEAVFVDNSVTIPSGASRNGSFAYPYSNIKTAFAAIKSGDLLYIRPGNGSYTVSADSGAPAGSTILKILDQQQIVGSGTSITVAGTKVAPLDPGTQPHLVFEDNSYKFFGVDSSATQATLQGLKITYDTNTSNGGSTTLLAVQGPTDMTILENSFVLKYPNLSNISYGIHLENTSLNQKIENNSFEIITGLNTSGQTSEVMRMENFESGSFGEISIKNNTASFNNKGFVIGSSTSTASSRTYTLNLSENTITQTLSDDQRSSYDFATALDLDLIGDNLSMPTLNIEKNKITSASVLTFSGKDSLVTATIKDNSLLGSDITPKKGSSTSLFTLLNDDTKASVTFNNNEADSSKSKTTVNFTNNSKTNSICNTEFKGNFFKTYKMLKAGSKKDQKDIKDIIFFVPKGQFESDQKNSGQSDFSDLSGASFNNVVCPN